MVVKRRRFLVWWIKRGDPHLFMVIFRFILTIFIVLGLLFALPGLVNLSQQTTRTLSRASVIRANIVIDINNTIGPLPESFKSLAQGGEERSGMLSAVIPEVKELEPKYIRIDHLYDFYDIVKRSDGSLTYNFSKLDAIVDDILATGALPFFSLSYMPVAISGDGTILGMPGNWDEWSEVVQRTVEHYSSKSQRNLTGVYYEVWNEPDLFGRFTMGGNKDYRLLYEYAAKGASKALDTNTYFLGGPSTTTPISSWISGLLQHASAKNLRLDFISYHRYGSNPSVYENDASRVRSIVSQYPKYALLPLVLSEWGFDSDLNSLNDGEVAAAFTMATINQIGDMLRLIMTFEIKDGLSPSGIEFWGRWGLLTHEQFGKHPKPRYLALKLLTALKGKRLGVSGVGTYVTALSTTDNGKVQILLTNYDPSGKNTESVPVKIKGLTREGYAYTLKDLTHVVESTADDSSEGEINKTVLLPANSIRLLEFVPAKKQSSGGTFVTGKSGIPSDKALVLDGKHKKLEFTPPEFFLTGGTLEFSLLPGFIGKEGTVSLFSLPLAGGQQREFTAKKMDAPLGPQLVYGIFENDFPKDTVSASMIDWKNGQWHDLVFGWGMPGLQLTVDGKLADEKKDPLQLGFGTLLTIEDNGTSIDNLRFTDGVRPLTTRTFDGTLDR